MSLSITLSLGGVDFCLSPSSPPQKGDADAKPIASVRRISIAGGTSSASGAGSVAASLEGFAAELAGFTGTLRVSLSTGTAGPSPSTSVLPAASKTSGNVDRSLEEKCRDESDVSDDGDVSDGVDWSVTSSQTKLHRSAEAVVAESARDGARSSVLPQREQIQFRPQLLQTKPLAHSQREHDSPCQGDNKSIPLDNAEEVAPSDECVKVGSVESPFRDDGSGSGTKLSLEIWDSFDGDQPQNKSNYSPENVKQKTAVWSEVLTPERSIRGFGMVRSTGQSHFIESTPFQKLLSQRYVDPDSPPPSLSLMTERDRPFRRIAIAKVIAHRKREQAHQLDDDQDMTPDMNISIGQERVGTMPAEPMLGSSKTALHRACADPNITLDVLRSTLEADPDAASAPDEKGNLPIHVITKNEVLLECHKDDVGTFVRDLLDVYPEGIIETDCEGDIPLAPIVRHWIENSYRTADEERGRAVSALGNGIFSPRHAFTRLGFRRDHHERGSTNDDDNDSGGGSGSSAIQTFSESMNKDKYNDLHPEVFAPPIVEWALVMLSLALDNFCGPLGRERGTRLEQLSSRGILADRIASIPLFLKTLLLIDDDETRMRILELSIVRRVMMRATSVNDWLIQLLKRPGTPSTRVVDYFSLVSKLDVSDFIGKDRRPKAADFEAFNKEKRTLFEAVQNYREILPSLLVLPRKQLEQISRSRLVWQVLDDTISRPFILSIVVIDLVLHLILLIAFRATLRAQGYASEMQQIKPPATRELVGILCCHQLIRMIGEGSHLLRISPSVFQFFLYDYWTWINVASIVLVWTSTQQLSSELKPNSVQLAISMALMWLRLLGLLKAMNMHLATYVVSVIEIFKDIRWYLVLLVCMLLMFADMIHILTSYSDGGSYCKVDFDDEESRVREDFCSKEILPSYFRMYGVLVGDFEIDDYRVIPLVAALFALFTFVGVILLLNVLIAIVR
uniref:Ion transport domain-containing protein n=1 Tax=Odontella aurita TaxID=265563 RepID=A0A7S4K3N0_9STRA|mmetsp:Transcript_60658/g.179880  ORF Transcript_60658/g.179880 Transcript_60658/m.179880 type:complete len:962 (+) Transcript_60658:227-3112(+)